MFRNYSMRALALILALLLAMPVFCFAEAAVATKLIDVKSGDVVEMNIETEADVNLGGRTVKSVKSSKPKFAKITKAGRISARTEGTTTITITFTDKSKLKFKVKVKDPYKPTSVSFKQGASITIRVGQSVTLTPVLTPTNAKTTYKWKSSKKKFASVKDGVVTGKKPGTTTVTVTTANKKKGNITVKVVANKADNLSNKPTSAQIRAISGHWTVRLKSVDIKYNKKVVLEFYLLNGCGRSIRVENFYINLWANGSQLVYGTVKKASAKSKRYQPKVIKITFPASALKNKNIDLTKLAPSAFSIRGINGDLVYYK